MCRAFPDSIRSKLEWMNPLVLNPNLYCQQLLLPC